VSEEHARRARAMCVALTGVLQRRAHVHKGERLSRSIARGPLPRQSDVTDELRNARRILTNDVEAPDSDLAVSDSLGRHTCPILSYDATPAFSNSFSSPRTLRSSPRLLVESRDLRAERSRSARLPSSVWNQPTPNVRARSTVSES
jgi:hypothetical protein